MTRRPPSPLYLISVCHTCTHCFVWDKDGILDSAAEQPLCGSPSKPALWAGINGVDQQIKLHCFYSFSISKPPLSSRNFLPLHWQGKASVRSSKADRSLPLPAFPAKQTRWHHRAALAWQRVLLPGHPGPLTGPHFSTK